MEEMAQQGTISKEDLSLVLLTDSIAEAAQHIGTFIKKNYREAPRRRKWWLFEKYQRVPGSECPLMFLRRRDHQPKAQDHLFGAKGLVRRAHINIQVVIACIVQLVGKFQVDIPEEGSP
jgi:hypothetical protein